MTPPMPASSPDEIERQRVEINAALARSMVPMRIWRDPHTLLGFARKIEDNKLMSHENWDTVITHFLAGDKAVEQAFKWLAAHAGEEHAGRVAARIEILVKKFIKETCK